MTITDTTRSPFFTATDPAPAPLAPVAELRARVIGPVTTPADPSYAGTVSPWQLAVAVQPQIAVEAVCAQDVVETVRFARRHGLTVTPQATGHGPISALVGVHTYSPSRAPRGLAASGAGVKWLRSSRRPPCMASPHLRLHHRRRDRRATPPAAVSARRPGPTASTPTESALSRSSPATACCRRVPPPSTPSSTSPSAAARAPLGHRHRASSSTSSAAGPSTAAPSTSTAPTPPRSSSAGAPGPPPSRSPAPLPSRSSSCPRCRASRAAADP